MDNKDELVIKINASLEKIRPYLKADGGDVSFVNIDADMNVQVRLTGACGHCPFSLHTLKAGVEQTLMQDIPQIKGVVAI